MRQQDREITISAEVWVSDILSKATDAELHQEMDDRCLAGTVRETVVQAINEIRRGAHADAITTLERQFFPKWKSSSACREKYEWARS